jgi:hypothetical protein
MLCPPDQVPVKYEYANRKAAHATDTSPRLSPAGRASDREVSMKNGSYRLRTRLSKSDPPTPAEQLIQGQRDERRHRSARLSGILRRDVFVDAMKKRQKEGLG